MIFFITGQPGAGKTALGLHRAFNYKKEGRTVYAHGIKDLDYEKAGFKSFPDDDPKNWQDLPDGSVIMIDECYGTFPNRNPASKVPDHVEAMARHRHRGFDFILIAQQGLQVDPFMRGLYESHEHVKKKWGKFTELRRWGSYQGNINGACSDKSNWTRPKYVFDYYTSTVADTSRNHMPSWLKWILILVAASLLITWYLKASTAARIEEARVKTEQAKKAATAPSVAGARGGAADGQQIHYANADEYADAHKARIPSLPWSAPIFDGRVATSQPVVYCVEGSPGLDALGNHRGASCSCTTEQGTEYAKVYEECLVSARKGGPYNPYKAPAPAATAPQAPAVNAAAMAPVGAAPAPVAVLSSPDVSGYGDITKPAPATAPR